jgi:hypothetical protein
VPVAASRGAGSSLWNIVLAFIALMKRPLRARRSRRDIAADRAIQDGEMCDTYRPDHEDPGLTR